MDSKITPFLWFDRNAEEAMNFYISVFPDSKILNVSHYGDEGPGPVGSVMTASFELAGQRFIALNGGPHYTFTEAVSFFVTCETQAEIDRYWDALCAGGGQPLQCGWLKDKFGLTWQIVPEILPDLIGSDDEKSGRAMQAMLSMVKFDIAALQAAYDGDKG